jgi:hypothetical protein
MFKVIGGDHKEYGPIGPEQIRLWIAEGRLSRQSLVRPEASADWKPLGSFEEFADALNSQVTSPATISLLTASGSAPLTPAEILARPAHLQIGRCLSRSWTLLKANLGLLAGACFLFWLTGVVCQFIPLIGGIIYLVIKGVLYGGLCLIFLNRIRGQPASTGDLFAGFSSAFAQLMLAGFLTSLIAGLGLVCCLILPGIYLLVAWTFSVPLVADKRIEFWPAMELSRKVVNRVWFEMFGLLLIVFSPFLVVNILVQIKLFSQIYPIIQDSMSHGQPDFGHLMGSMTQIAAASLLLSGLIKLVLLFNLPFAVGTLLYAYEDLFGTRTESAA